jgi:hypothetical protein
LFERRCAFACMDEILIEDLRDIGAQQNLQRLRGSSLVTSRRSLPPRRWLGLIRVFDATDGTGRGGDARSALCRRAGRHRCSLRVANRDHLGLGECSATSPHSTLSGGRPSPSERGKMREGPPSVSGSGCSLGTSFSMQAVASQLCASCWPADQPVRLEAAEFWVWSLERADAASAPFTGELAVGRNSIIQLRCGFRFRPGEHSRVLKSSA